MSSLLTVFSTYTCPHCGYKYADDAKYHGRRAKARPSEQEKYGPFFSFDLQMQRPDPNWMNSVDKCPLLGCPKCNMVFMYRSY